MPPLRTVSSDKVVLLLWAGCLLLGGQADRAFAIEIPTAGYARPEADAVRAELRDILSDPKFAPRKTISEWLTDKLLNWRPPDLNAPAWLVKTLVWTILIWCVLALLAILVHLLWTLSCLLGVGVPSGTAEPRRTRADRLRHQPLEQVLATMQTLAEQGRFRESLGVMMLAVLRILDRSGAVRFHESKTNGEYVLEYSMQRPERQEFKQFVSSFESTVYGGRECGPEHYRGMYDLFQRIQAHVGEPQN